MSAENTNEEVLYPIIDLKSDECMSLRDWFAGMALSNFEIRRYQHGENYHIIAEACYKIADAMIKERENNE